MHYCKGLAFSLLAAMVASCTLITERPPKDAEAHPPVSTEQRPKETVAATVEPDTTTVISVPVETPHITEVEAEETLETTNKELPAEPAQEATATYKESDLVSPEESLPDYAETLCQEIGAKLGSVDYQDCANQQLIHAAKSIQGKSLAYKDFEPLSERTPLGRVLVIGGIHGDEFSSVSVVFKWMEILQEHHSGLFHWRFIPAANPDGLLMKKSQRQNFSGVDLNRNFPTTDWGKSAMEYWKKRTYSNPRRYPGKTANSEPETQFLVEQIAEFAPDVIISMHAPYHLVDYDGPPSAPDKLGSLYLRQLGVYPGSLGNYIGVDQKKPIVTVELKSAGIMPSPGEIDRMWTDLVRWLRNQLG